MAQGDADLHRNVYQSRLAVALSSGIDVTRTSYAARITHVNNGYHLAGSSVANLTLGPTEVNTTAAVYVDTTNADPARWDDRLLGTSPARGVGVDVGITKNILGAPVPTPPNAGAY